MAITTIASTIQKSSHPGLRVNLRRVKSRRNTVIKASDVNTQVTVSTAGPRFWSPPGGTGTVGDCDIMKKLGGAKRHALLDSYAEG